MKRSTAIVLVVAAVMVCSVGYSSHVHARVYVPLPEFVIDAEPDLVVIPGTYVYRVPDIETDILFYQGFWYRPFEGRWYRSRSYNGPWGFITVGRVPLSLRRLPVGYRSMHFELNHRMHYGDLQRNWRGWERQRHWDRDDRWREGRDHGLGDDRGRGDRGSRGGHGDRDDRGHGGDDDGGRR